MKKAFLLFLMLIIACFIIIGCKDSSNNTNNSSNANVGVLRDLSVNLEKNYSVPDSDSNVIELASTPDELYQNDLKKLISISDDVVRVTVQNVAYTGYEGVAWTKLDVLITDTLKGDLKVGDVISVFNLGGYIPLSEHIEGHNDAFRFKNLSAEEIKTTFLKETIDGEKKVQKSDDLILCLVQTPKNSPLPNGAYERVSYTGQLYADGDNKFVQLITDSSETTEKTYSYDDIKKMTEYVCLRKFSIKLSFIMKIIKQGGVSIEKSNMFYFMSAYFFLYQRL